MKNLVLLVVSVIFFTLGNAYARDRDVAVSSINVAGGIDFTYSAPEMFFTEPEVLKLSTIWEILNCYVWDGERPTNQCVNLEFYVVNSGTDGDRAFSSVLEGTQCFSEGCDAVVKLPLAGVLGPVEYAQYQEGVIVIKEITMHLAFGGEEDQFGRIVGRKFASAFYTLKFILNGTGFGSVAIMSIERSVAP